MRRAWAKARASAVNRVRLRVVAIPLRESFACELRIAWDEAKGARTLAVWRAEREAAIKAAKALDDRTREIMKLQERRAFTIVIDSTRRYLAERAAVDARLL